MAGCCFAECQAPIQAFLRPGIWCPGVRRLHMIDEEWKMSASVDECMEAFQAAVESLSEAEHLQVHKVKKDDHFIQVFAFTACCNWLDVVEVKFSSGSESSVTVASARSFSSGFVPACIPLAFLWNMLLFWVPFSGKGFNSRRLSLIRDTMQLPVEVTSKTTCSCAPP